jgi:hypothetical protein
MTTDSIRTGINHTQAIFNFILYTIAACQPCLKPVAANTLALTDGVAYNV